VKAEDVAMKIRLVSLGVLVMVCGCGCHTTRTGTGAELWAVGDFGRSLHDVLLGRSVIWLTALHMCENVETDLLHAAGSAYDFPGDASCDMIPEPSGARYGVLGYVESEAPQEVGREAVFLIPTPTRPAIVDWCERITNNLDGFQTDDALGKRLVVYLYHQEQAEANLIRLAFCVEQVAEGRMLVTCESAAAADPSAVKLVEPAVVSPHRRE
jgi:hypothetical protein